MQTPLCTLVTIVKSFAFPIALINGKEPPLAPIEAMASSPQPVIELLPLWLALLEPLEHHLVP
jgi:hypothetical protein